MPIIEENHIDYARAYLNKTSANDHFYYKPPPTSSFVDIPDLRNTCEYQDINLAHLSPRLKNSKHFGSAPSMLQVYDETNFMQDKCLVAKFTKQVLKNNSYYFEKLNLFLNSYLA